MRAALERWLLRPRPSGYSDFAAPASALAAALLGSGPASAQADAGAPPLVRSACVEHVPEGKARPQLMESFPARGKAGYAAVLEIEIPHGLGETVLPSGFRLQLDSSEGKSIEAAQFRIPDVDGPAAPRLSRSESSGGALTTVQLSFVPLPDEPGPHEMTLPPVPIAIARASGEQVTVCTKPHSILVDDPTSNVAHAKPRPNPPPLRQLEVWSAAKNVALGGLIALPLGILTALLVGYWLKRERPAPPAPPPRPAWDVALEALAEVRSKRWIERGQATRHFVEVSLAVRRYLGDRYGFDGLESTTRELLVHLEASGAQQPVRDDAGRLLRRADLVKFANLTPEAAECELALDRGESLIRRTMPTPGESTELRGAARTPSAPDPEPPDASGERS